MKKGIKEKDIRDFEKYAKKLNEVSKRIREYRQEAYIYATPQQLNLMGDADDKEAATHILVEALEAGDW